MAKKNAELSKGAEKGEKSGRPGKAAHHEGAAGEGERRDLGGGKWSKEGRDAGEKEPGKSRR